VNGRRPWSDAEDAFLRALPELMTRDAAAYLGRTPAAVDVRRSRLKDEGRG
jgi:hypothetical protein